MRHVPLLPVFCAVLLCASLALLPRPALACGGCFIPASSSAVVQDAERILFVQDPATKKSVVWVEVKYNGPGGDFGWVLPLPKQPKVGVGTSYLFDRLDAATAPRFNTTTLPGENCGRAVPEMQSSGCGMVMPRASANGATGVNFAAEDSVKSTLTVLQQDQIGPYNYVVLAAKNSDDLLAWLKTHGYKMPPAAQPIVDSHVQKGDVFVAVKLVSGASAKEIKPITLTMDDAEPCVPLRLTAIAAAEDMTVQTYLAGPGRAIPKNHLHVQLNPLRINWFGGASNYGQVVAAAIDEAAGHAFVTEFVGQLPSVVSVPQPFGGQSQEPLLDKATLDLTGLAQSTTASQAITLLRGRKFPIGADSAAILEKHMGLAAAAGQGDKVTAFYQQLHEGGAEVQAKAIDGKALAAQLETEFTQPLLDILPQILAAKRLSRLVMRISPAEMDKDPVFAFHPTLPDVSNVRTADVNPVCRKGDWTTDAWRLTLKEAGKDVGSYVIDTKTGTAPQGGGILLPNNAKDPRFEKAPAAQVVELLDETTKEPVALHPDDIAVVDMAIAGAQVGKTSLPAGLTLKKADARWVLPKSDPVFASPVADEGGCTLDRTARRPLQLGALFAFGLLALLAVRRRVR